MTASELFAIALGLKNELGSEECHWCASSCPRKWVHDDPPPIPFKKSQSTAKRPSHRFVCTGCYYYRMKRVTVRYLMEGYSDKQRPEDHSWWVSEDGAFAIRKENHPLLWEYLLSPPPRFYFSLLTEPERIKNHLQCCIINDNPAVDIDTKLQFTIDNVPYTYTVYELEEALSTKESDGKEPGVRELIRLLQPYHTEEKAKKQRGRPKEESNPLAKK